MAGKFFCILLVLPFFLFASASYSQERLKWKDIDSIDFDKIDSDDAVLEYRATIEDEPPAEEETQQETTEEEKAPEFLAFPDLPYNTRIYAIGVHQGEYPTGMEPRENFHPRANVRVQVKKIRSPMVLVLTAYEPVMWTINANAGADIRAVIVSGNHKQSVFGMGSKAKLLNVSGKGAEDAYFYAYQNSGEDYARVEAAVQKLTGKTIDGFQGEYQASKTFIIE